MPMRSEVIRTSDETEARIMTGQLPVEVYLKIALDNPEDARDWVRAAAAVLDELQFDPRLDEFERAVLWGPRGAESNQSNVFLSELAVRLLRASGRVRVPATKVVSLTDLDHGLKMYRGGAADEQIYQRIKQD